MKLVRIIWLIVLLCSGLYEVNSQSLLCSDVRKEFSLEQQYGRFLKCPDSLRPTALQALCHFPELKGVIIKVQFAKINTTANCRPAASNVFKHHRHRSDSLGERCNRIYIITINNREKFEGVLYKDVPPRAKVGLIGHELAHVVDYENRSLFRIVGRGFDYTSQSRKSRYEKEIDSLTVARGLGHELYEWADFVLNRSTATERYKSFKKSTYLSPDEILHIARSVKSE